MSDKKTISLLVALFLLSRVPFSLLGGVAILRILAQRH